MCSIYRTSLKCKDIDWPNLQSTSKDEMPTMLLNVEPSVSNSEPWGTLVSFYDGFSANHPVH